MFSFVRRPKIALFVGGAVGLLVVVIAANIHLSWYPAGTTFGVSAPVTEPRELPIAWRGKDLWLLSSAEGVPNSKALPSPWRRAPSWDRGHYTIVRGAFHDDDLVALSSFNNEFARSDGDDQTAPLQLWGSHGLVRRFKERDEHTSFGVLKAQRPALFSFSPDGKTLVSDSELDRPEPKGDEVVPPIPAGYCTYGAVLFDVQSGRQIARQQAVEGCFTSFAWSPDSREVAGLTADGWVFVWSSSTGKLRLKFRAHQLFGAQIVWSPGGKTLLTASNPRAGYSPTHLGYDLKAGVSFTIEGQGKMTSEVEGAQLSVISNAVGDATWNGRTERLLKRFDATTGQLVGTPIPLETGAVSLAFSPDGKRLALGEHNFALVIDAQTLATQRRLALPPLVTPSRIPLPVCVAWSADGATLATSTQRGLALWRMK